MEKHVMKKEAKKRLLELKKENPDIVDSMAAALESWTQVSYSFLFIF